MYSKVRLQSYVALPNLSRTNIDKVLQETADILEIDGYEWKHETAKKNDKDCRMLLGNQLFQKSLKKEINKRQNVFSCLNLIEYTKHLYGKSK